MRELPTKHNFRDILVFSILAGIFAGALTLVVAGILYAAGWYPSPLQQVLAAVGLVAGATFVGVILWLFLWFLGERLGGRIGAWQALPKWLIKLLGKPDTGAGV